MARKNKIPVKGDCSKYRAVEVKPPIVVNDSDLQIIMLENGTAEEIFNGVKVKKKKAKRTKNSKKNKKKTTPNY